MINLRQLNIMQQHIGNAQHIRKLLFLDTVNGLTVFLHVVSIFYLRLQLFQPAGQKAAGAAGKVRHFLSDGRFNHLCHKVRYGTGSIKFTGRTCALQLF